MEVTDFTPGLDWKQNSALAISSWTSPPLDRRRRRGGSRRSAPPLIRQQGGRGVGGRWDVHNQHSMGRAGQINNLTILPFKGGEKEPASHCSLAVQWKGQSGRKLFPPAGLRKHLSVFLVTLIVLIRAWFP